MPRLDPSTTTITKLILASGARCAFPNCSQRLVENDQLIGQICHIEAAAPAGQRYNSEQSDNERRAFDNLILLCANHHKVTDDINIYTVEKLKQMKHVHETKMEDEPSMDLSVLNRVVASIGGSQDEFRYIFTGNFQPYKDFDYIADSSAAESKLRGQLQHLRNVAGNSSATEYAEKIFSSELAKMKRPYTDRKANSDKMYALELSRIQDFYGQLNEKEMSKVRARGMGESGQVIVLEEKILKYKEQALVELNILYGKS